MKNSPPLISWLLYICALLCGIGGAIGLLSAFNARTTLAGLLTPFSIFGLKQIADILQSTLVSVLSTLGIAFFILCLVLCFLFLVAGRLITRSRSLDERVLHLEQQVADLQAKMTASAPGDRE